MNNNNICDDNEPSSVTKSDGSYELSIKKNTKLGGSFRVLAKAPKSTSNHIFGNTSTRPLTTSIVLGSTVFLDKDGNLTQGTSNITPFSTLASLTTPINQEEKISEEDYLKQLENIAADLGVSKSAALTDYNSDSTSKDALTALVAGETLVRSNLIPQDEAELDNISNNGLLTPESVKESISQYKEAVADVSTTLDKSISSGEQVSGEQIAKSLEKAEDQLGSSFRVLASGSSDDWSCGVTRNNNVYCWGNNSWGNLGDPELYEKTMAAAGKTVQDEGTGVSNNFSAQPVAVKILVGKDAEGKNVYAPLSNVRTVALGNIHACAVTYSGEVYCWGGNWRGQLGVVEEIIPKGEDANYKFLYAQKVLKGQQESNSKYLTNIESISMAQNSSCAITRDGELYCWGDNTSSRLGSRYYEGSSYNYPWNVMNYEVEIEMASGKGGKACNPTSPDCSPEFIQIVPTPVRVKFPDSVARVKKVIPGIWAYCALTENKSTTDKHNLYCWGNDIVGTISHNFSKHFIELAEKYIGKKTHYNDVYKYTEPWNWTIFEGGGDYHPLFGEPVTLIDAFNNPEEVEYKTFDSEEQRDEYLITASTECRDGTNGRTAGCIVEPGYDEDSSSPYTVTVLNIGQKIDIGNVTDVALQGHDNTIILALTPVTDFDDPTKEGKAGIYKGWNFSFWNELDFSAPDSPIGNEWIKRIIANSSSEFYYLLTGNDQLFFKGDNRYGLAGRNVQDTSVGISDFVLAPDGESKLSNVVDVAMGKRSICASVRKTIDKESDTESSSAKSFDSAKFDMLCWGSSAFGQLGFDNGDGGFSFGQAMTAWDGANNMYLDKQTRYLILPLEVTSCMFHGQGCPEAPEPEPEIKLDLSDLEIQPEDGYVYISIVDPKGETITMGNEDKVDLYWWATGDSDPYNTNPAANNNWFDRPYDDGINWQIRKDDESDATVLTYKIPVAGYGNFCGIPRKGTAEGDKLYPGDLCITFSDAVRTKAFRIFDASEVTETLNDLFEQEE